MARRNPSDLVQETLLKAHQHFDQFQGQTEAELIAWLRRIWRGTWPTWYAGSRWPGALIRREQSLNDLVNDTSRAVFELVAPNGHSPSQSAQRRNRVSSWRTPWPSWPPTTAKWWCSGRSRAGTGRRSPTRWAAARRVRLLWARALKKLRPLIEARGWCTRGQSEQAAVGV